MGYQGTPDTALARASLDLVHDHKRETRGTGLRIFEVGLWDCAKPQEHYGEGGPGQNQVEKKRREKGIKTGQPHVNPHWSAHLSDQALHPITPVCPIFLLKPFLTVFLYNLTAYPMRVNALRTRCQQLGAQEDMGLATEVRWGCRHPGAVVPAAAVGEGLSPALGTGLACPGHSCWRDWGERGTQHWLLEQDCGLQPVLEQDQSRSFQASLPPKSFHDLSYTTGVNEATLT